MVDRLSSDLPIAAVNSSAEALSDPQLAERMHAFALDPETGDTIKKFELPISFESETEQDRQSVTDAAGYDEATLTELREDGVLSGDD